MSLLRNKKAYLNSLDVAAGGRVNWRKMIPSLSGKYTDIDKCHNSGKHFLLFEQKHIGFTNSTNRNQLFLFDKFVRLNKELGYTAFSYIIVKQAGDYDSDQEYTTVGADYNIHNIKGTTDCDDNGIDKLVKLWQKGIQH